MVHLWLYLGCHLGLVVPTSDIPKTTGLVRIDSTVSSLLHPGCGLEWVAQLLGYLWGISPDHGMVVGGVSGVVGSATPGRELSIHLCPHGASQTLNKS